MALERRSASNTVFLQAKHYCLWQELKKPAENCETVEVTNPKTGEVLQKHGFSFNTLNARVTKVVKYDTERQFATRFFGFKMHMQDGADYYVFDMPYNSAALRRFLAVAPNIDWTVPLSITVFKGKKRQEGAGADPLVVWFRQHGETVKAFFARETPNGMPPAIHDDVSGEWDFREQRRWLVKYMVDKIIPAIELAAARIHPPEEPVVEQTPEPQYDQRTQQQDVGGAGPPDWDLGIDDSDVPF